MKRRLLAFLIILSLSACISDKATSDAPLSVELGDSLNFSEATDSSVNRLVPPRPENPPPMTKLEKQLREQGLQKVREIIPEANQDLKYSTTDNFLGQDVYGDFNECYLQKEVVDMLAEAQSSIMAEHPDLRLLLYDCVRPRSVQYQMWEIVKGTDQQKYVAAPGGGGSMHNYGAAVDLGLIHIDTGVVDMGTTFDFFGNLAQPRYESQFLASGELRQEQADNRMILRLAMRKAGFHMIMSEWWHFNAFDRPTVRKKYQIVE